ncbi:hypothetical protein GIB67_035604 [Kingdonia uniflora]|uniref:Aminotransferase-like plant mobile domain-containing protein n=1 Tax=Kingdonia uniflora TaxID=39325 RepID=A0A7J7LKX2_9MAGN|nr:hypothetical protein GIB67_035604 [Kingdonia uniflora]
MHMPEGEPYPSTMPGLRGTGDPESTVTRSRSGRKKSEWNLKMSNLNLYQTQPKKTSRGGVLPNSQTESVTSITRERNSHHIKSGNVSIAHLKTYLTVAANREDDITIARAFILFMMGHLWFQAANNTVPLGYLTAVADFDSVAQYDWGFSILASLYHGLDTAVTTGDAITGFVQLLTYWFYEYCGVGHPIVKEEDLQLRRGNDIRVVPLPPGGGTRTRQRGSGLQTRGGYTSRRGQGTGDDSE